MNSRTLAAALTVALTLPLAAAPADDVRGKMLALLPQFDADGSDGLNSDEQAKALAAVKSRYGEAWAGRIESLFRKAAGPDRTVEAKAWRKLVDEWQDAPRPQTFRVAMKDGKHLATDVLLPDGGGPFPVVLTRTPYGRGQRLKEGAAFVRAGMVFVAQDVRGRFDSEGENAPFIGCGWSGHQDGVDTINWLKQQPWCNGRIGTIGGSAGGITQNLLAGAAPDGLRAQYISVAAASLYSDAVFTGGALRKADAENWTQHNRFDPRAFAAMLEHPANDSYWDMYDTTKRYGLMNVPAVHLGGWFDMFAQGTLDEFTGRQHHGAEGSRGRQKLIMGPWAHALGKMPVGELTFPGSGMPKHLDPVRWFGHCLMDQTNGIDREPAVTYYVMGDVFTPGAPGNEWRQAPDWPVPSVETPFYFHPDRSLAAQLPPAGEAAAEFTFDPASPCPSIGGGNLTIDAGPRNQNRIENRDDVLVFSTAPLTEPTEVTGRVRARIFVSSSAVDTDLSVRLCDVCPDGRSFLMAEGMLRLRYRKSLSAPELLTPGRMEEVTVDCWSTSIIFNRGHRIRATVTSSNFPRFDVNPGTGVPVTEGAATVKQKNRIACDANHASCLLLPVVKSKSR